MKHKILFTSFILTLIITSISVYGISASTASIAGNMSVEKADGISPSSAEQMTSDLNDTVIRTEMPPLSSDGYVLYYKYDSILPNSVAVDLQYNLYHTTIDYVFVKGGSVNIRQGPGTYHPVIRVSEWYEKISVLEAVQGEHIAKYGGDMWYKVAWEDDNGIHYGYVLSALVDLRKYEFDKMLDSLYELDNEISQHQTAFISNYKNRNGRAPYYKGKAEDIYGNVRYQSAPGYYNLDNKSEFIYLIDGTILSILEENDSYYHVKTLIHDETFWVPKRFVNVQDWIQPFTQIIVIDRTNQNQAVFEKRENGWALISYTLATTGADTKFKFPTPIGYFMAIEKKPQFLYLDDYTRQISGYAPYVLRFSGGAYIHGIPVEFKKWGGQLVDPGQREYSTTIGTIPRSHKCVRNYTSHAKFLYDWARIGELGVIVID